MRNSGSVLLGKLFANGFGKREHAFPPWRKRHRLLAGSQATSGGKMAAVSTRAGGCFGAEDKPNGGKLNSEVQRLYKLEFNL